MKQPLVVLLEIMPAIVGLIQLISRSLLKLENIANETIGGRRGKVSKKRRGGEGWSTVVSAFLRVIRFKEKKGKKVSKKR